VVVPASTDLVLAGSTNTPFEGDLDNTFDLCSWGGVTNTIEGGGGPPLYNYALYIQRPIVALYNGSTISSTAAPGSTPTPPLTSSTGRPKASGPSSSHSSGLSTGAAAGIGVGVSIGALTITAALAFWLLSKRRKRRESPTDNYTKPELHGKPVEQYKIVNEAAVGEIHEMPAESQPVEMQGERSAASVEDGRQ
jgi:hypothetical protein